MTYHDSEKTMDIRYDPGEMLKIKNIVLDMSSQSSHCSFIFNIKLSIKEKLNKTITKNETDCDNVRPVKAYINCNTTKQYELTIFTKELDFPLALSDNNPPQHRIQNIRKDYQKDKFIIDGIEYHEKISLQFEVLTLGLIGMNEQVIIGTNNFSYIIFFQYNEAGTESTLVIDDIKLLEDNINNRNFI